MAKNTNNNRIPVKWVRDKAKAAYEKKGECHICGIEQDLELHHTQSITLLLNAWAAKNKHNIDTDEGILAVRDEFIDTHHKELYEDVVTLCNTHHVALHNVYGKSPTLSSGPKQLIWLEKQKAKYGDGYVEPEKIRSELNPFAAFY